MNESAAPAAAVDPGTANASGVETINGAIKVYNQKKSAELMGKSGAMAGGAGAKDQYLAKFKKGPSAGSVVGVTSLDQLVTAKVLKSIPEPPAGKKYVLDTQKQEVRLENK